LIAFIEQAVGQSCQAMSLLRLIVGCVAVVSCSAGPVVITGATGHTGALTYNLLKSQGVEVRGLVRSVTKAKEVLGCSKCDESEGIFVGDVTKPETLTGVMQGADALVILTSAFPICNPYPQCNYTKGGYPVDVDFNGGKNQVEAFVKGAGGLKPVLLVSAAGTTEPDSQLDKMGNGHISFYKLNMESFLMASTVPYTIVKPCGLGLGKPAVDEMLVGHDDAENWDLSVPIQRSDVARVLAAAIKNPKNAANLRFDLCAKAGTPTKDGDLDALLKSARYPWELSKVVV